MKSGFGWWVPVASVACALIAPGADAIAGPHDALITKHAAAHGVPETLVRRVIHIESKGNPRVVSKGNYGLMQIRLGTAKAMGYRGTAEGLLDADTNMTYAVKYLAGAYRAAGGNHNRAVAYYAGGYYYAAKRQGFSPYATQARAAVPAAVATRVPAMVQPVRAEMF
jgi:soluble lytic murein transglycosylase-like protein